MKMKLREMVLISMAFIAVCYGMFNFLFHKEEKFNLKNMMTDLDNYIVDISRRIAISRLGTEGAYTIAKAETPWSGDLFYVPEQVSQNKSEPSKPADKEALSPPAPRPDIEASFTGYMEVNGMGVAIINGNRYIEGDGITVSEMKLRVAKITPLVVTLQELKGSKTYRLNYRQKD